MADPVTPNVGLAVPTRGSDVGTWDLPVNGDFTIIDQMYGGVTSVSPSSAVLNLTSSQGQVASLQFVGTIVTPSLANVWQVRLPSIYKRWIIDNQITNSPSSYCVQLISSNGSIGLGLAPGINDVLYDGTNIRYVNMGKLGEYWDYANAAVPSWVTVSSVPPWLYCNGTTFSSAVYPQLANLLGSNTLPDFRGRQSAYLNQGTGRMTTAGAGVDGNTLFASGGGNGLTLVSSQIPTITATNAAQNITVSPGPYNVPVATGGIAVVPVPSYGSLSAPYTGGTWTSVQTFSGTNAIFATYTNASPQPVGATLPVMMSGIRMIKAI